MSWQVDGRGPYYHTRAEYLEAVRRRDERQAHDEVGRARRQVSELQSRISLREAELDQARSDIDRQIRVTEEIRTDVAQLHRAQGRLQQAQAAMEEQMNAEFADVRQEIQATQVQVGELEREQGRMAQEQREMTREMRAGFEQVRCELGTTQAELTQLEQAHEEHVRKVQRTFQDVRHEMERGLETAEERRRLTEERLQNDIQHVDHKVEEDRRDLLAKIQNEMQRAEEATRTVESALRIVEAELGALDLEEEAQSIREQISQARGSIGKGDSATALAIANAAFGQARALRYRVNRRRAALNSRKAAAEQKGMELTSAVGGAQIADWFPAESARVRELLADVLEQARGRYRQYSRLEIQASRDEEILDRLEQQIDLMIASAPNIAEQAEERKGHVKAIVEKLRRIYGPISDAKQSFALEGDPKSPLIVQCKFGGARVDVHVALDGSMKLDAYGHDSNTTCSAKARAIMAEFGREQRVRQQVSLENRTEPAIQRDQAPPIWKRLAGSIDDIRRKM